MKLTKIVIDAFRSVRTPQTLHIDQLVTVLIGPNDNGKTNLLEAIRALNDDHPHVETDRNWDVEDPAKPRIEYHFELDPEEIKQLKALLVAPVVESVTTPRAPEGEDVATSPEVKSVTFVRSGVGRPVEVLAPTSVTSNVKAKEFVLKSRPRVELFLPLSSKIKDTITLAELNAPDNEFMQGIFRKAGLWEYKDKLFTQTQKTSKQLADGSKLLTQQIRKEWEQGRELSFKLNHSGTNGNTISLQIQDPAVTNQYVLPSQRSSGFSAFFVLNLTLFARQEMNPANRYIFLFDEPGTYLHPQGQINLQRIFETLSGRNQVLFTTQLA